MSRKKKNFGKAQRNYKKSNVLEEVYEETIRTRATVIKLVSHNEHYIKKQ